MFGGETKRSPARQPQLDNFNTSNLSSASFCTIESYAINCVASKMTEITLLPDDIIREVCDYFDSVHLLDNYRDAHNLRKAIRDNQDTLCNLCLASPQFRSVAQPMLERTIWDNGERIKTWDLTNRFAKYPHVAARVKTISVVATGFDDKRREPKHHKLVEMYPELLERARAIQAEGRWIHVLDGRSVKGWENPYEAEVGLMLASLTNLDTLQVRVGASGWPVTNTDALMAFLQMQWYIDGILPNLRQLMLLYDENQVDYMYHRGFSIGHAEWQQVLNIRTLRVLRVALLTDNHGMYLPESFSNIETLDLQKSHVSTSFLRATMKAFHHLKQFRYEWGWQTSGMKEDIGLAGLVDNLSFQQNSLEVILLVATDSDYFEQAREISQPLG